MLFAIQEAKKLPENDNLRKIHNQFEQHNSGEQHTGRQRSDSAEPDSSGFPKSNSSQRKRSEASGKRGFHPCFCLPACCNCPVALSESIILLLIIQLYLNWTAFKNAIAAGKTDCISNLLRKCGLLAHTSAAFLKNCCTKKLFSCLRLVLEKPLAYGSARLGHIPSLPWKSQLPLKPYLSLQPFLF